MALSTVSVLSTVLVLYLHHKVPNYRVPHWLLFVAIKILSRVLCIRQPTPNHQNHVLKDPNGVSAVSSHLIKTPGEDSVEMNLLESSADKVFPTALQSLTRQVEEVTAQLKLLTSRFHHHDEEKEVIEEWQAVAKVLDRLLFWIVLLVLVGTLIWLMYMSLHTKHNFDVE